MVVPAEWLVGMSGCNVISNYAMGLSAQPRLALDWLVSYAAHVQKGGFGEVADPIHLVVRGPY